MALKGQKCDIITTPTANTIISCEANLLTLFPFEVQPCPVERVDSACAHETARGVATAALEPMKGGDITD
jgi:hypothetical protein